MDMIQKHWNVQNALLNSNSSVKKFTDAASSVFFDRSIDHHGNVTTTTSSSSSSSTHPISHDNNNNNNKNKVKLFIDSLPLPLRHDATKAITFPNESSTVSSSSSVIDLRIGHLEISSRSQVISLTQDLTDTLNHAALHISTEEWTQIQNNSMDSSSLLSDCEEALEELLLFVRSVADLCICIITLARCDNNDAHDSSIHQMETDRLSSRYDFKRLNTPQVGRLPFILLEDIVETLPAQYMQLVWTFGPGTWIHPWCREKPNTLNVLNRQLDVMGPLLSSSSHFTLIRFCNKLIKKNGIMSSITTTAHTNSWARAHNVSNIAFIGQVGLILASVLPLSDPSVAHTSGTLQKDRYDTMDTLEQFDHRKTTSTETSRASSTMLTYDHYLSFWSIQQVFADPSCILPPPGKGASSNSQEWLPRLGTFLSHVRAIIDTLKDLTSCHESMDHHRDLTNKYTKDRKTLKAKSLTYSLDSILHQAQWQDPKVRTYILIQIIFTCSFLQSQLSSTTSLPIKIKTVLINHSTNIQNILEESKIILSQTLPDGKEYLKTVTWILNEREPMWRHWKQNKCIPAIEDIGGEHYAKNKSTKIVTPDRPQEGGLSPNDVNISTRLINKVDATSSTTEMNMQSFYAKAIDSFSFSIHISDDLPQLSKSLKKCAPTLDDHLKEYIEALDPEAGIEEEYHPKNDLVWKWRAMRLLNKKAFHYYDKNLVRKTDGDFEGLVRMIWAKEKGINLPGEEKFLHQCQLDNDCLPDELDDDDEEELIANAMRLGTKKTLPITTSSPCLKESESFSSGEIDENDNSKSMDELIDTQIIERSEVINDLDDVKMSHSESQGLLDPVVNQNETLKHDASRFDVIDETDDDCYRKNEANMIETAAFGMDLKSSGDADREGSVTINETCDDVQLFDVAESNIAKIEAPERDYCKEPSTNVIPQEENHEYLKYKFESNKETTHLVEDDAKRSHDMTREIVNASSDSRKRKFDSSEVEVPLEQPWKKRLVDDSQSKPIGSDNNRTIPRAGQYHNQRRNDKYPSTYVAPNTSNAHQHRGSVHRSGDQYHPDMNRVNNSYQNIPPSQPPYTSQTSSQSFSTTGSNRRDGSRGYGHSVSTQSSSNMSHRRPGENNRGYGEVDRRSGGYSRQR